jgi:hypothetical protein
MERVVSFTTLGVRFWDAARDTRIDDGLVVRARLDGAPHEVRQADVTHAGIYAFRRLPRMHRVEYPFPPEPVLGSGPLPPAVPFIVDVRDPRGRFVPMAFRVDVPFRGIFPTGFVNGAPGNVPGFFLFSAPNRATPAKLAGVRMSLALEATGAPASHAVAELTLPDGSLVYAVAGDDGQATAIFPYPAFDATPPTPLTPDQARAPATWPLSLRVLYEPARQAPLGDGLPPDTAELFQQAPVNILTSAANPAAGNLAITLVFGRDLVIRTDDQPDLLLA